jgi:hypothetical protein
MAYEIMTEDQEGEPIGTSQGWPDFCEWVDSLDEDSYPELVAFTEEGDTYVPKELMLEVKRAVQAEDPEPDIKDTARGLFDFLKAHRNAEMVMVVSGVTAE